MNLPSELINKIVMMNRPLYPYMNEMKDVLDYANWYITDTGDSNWMSGYLK